MAFRLGLAIRSKKWNHRSNDIGNTSLVGQWESRFQRVARKLNIKAPVFSRVSVPTPNEAGQKTKLDTKEIPEDSLNCGAVQQTTFTTVVSDSDGAPKRNEESQVPHDATEITGDSASSSPLVLLDGEDALSLSKPLMLPSIREDPEKDVETRDDEKQIEQASNSFHVGVIPATLAAVSVDNHNREHISMSRPNSNNSAEAAKRLQSSSSTPINNASVRENPQDLSVSCASVEKANPQVLSVSCASVEKESTHVDNNSFSRQRATAEKEDVTALAATSLSRSLTGRSDSSWMKSFRQAADSANKQETNPESAIKGATKEMTRENSYLVCQSPRFCATESELASQKCGNVKSISGHEVEAQPTRLTIQARAASFPTYTQVHNKTIPSNSSKSIDAPQLLDSWSSKMRNPGPAPEVRLDFLGACDAMQNVKLDVASDVAYRKANAPLFSNENESVTTPGTKATSRAALLRDDLSSISSNDADAGCFRETEPESQIGLSWIASCSDFSDISAFFDFDRNFGRSLGSATKGTKTTSTRSEIARKKRGCDFQFAHLYATESDDASSSLCMSVEIGEWETDLIEESREESIRRPSPKATKKEMHRRLLSKYSKREGDQWEYGKEAKNQRDWIQLYKDAKRERDRRELSKGARIDWGRSELFTTDRLRRQLPRDSHNEFLWLWEQIYEHDEYAGMVKQCSSLRAFPF